MLPSYKNKTLRRQTAREISCQKFKSEPSWEPMRTGCLEPRSGQLPAVSFSLQVLRIPFFFFFPLLGLHYGKRSGFVPLPALHAVIKVPRGRWPAVASAGEALCWSVAAACRLVASAHHVRGAFLIKREPVGATSCGNSAWS